MAIHHWLDQTAVAFPSHTALISKEGSMSYEELYSESNKLATYFTTLGTAKGDRIVVCLPNSPFLAISVFASSRIGALFVLLHEDTMQSTLEYVLQDCEPTIVITSRSKWGYLKNTMTSVELVYIEDLEDLEDELHNDTSIFPVHGEGATLNDLACLIYTSGSTGRPKAVMPTHHNMMFTAQAIQETLQYEQHDIIGCFLPLSFDYGLYQLFLCVQIGATLAIGSQSEVGPAWINKLIEWNVTGLPAMPSMFFVLNQLVRRNPAKIPKLRFITNTGANLPESYIEDFQRWFPDTSIYLMYGLTECKRVSILNAADLVDKKGSVGLPLPNTECYIVDCYGVPVPPGCVGELVVRGPHVTSGYWKDDLTTQHFFRTWNFGEEVVLFTGDQCSLDPEGYLYYHGRKDDIFKLRGYRVSCTEIERYVLSIDGVHQAAVLIPTENENAALIVTAEQSVDEIRSELRHGLEHFKIPEIVIKIEKMPLSANGKYDLKALRQYLKGVGTL